MSKEELIKFIESIDFEICSQLSFSYFKKVKNSYYGSNENGDEYKEKTITFNRDLKDTFDEKIERLRNDVVILNGIIDNLIRKGEMNNERNN